MSRTSRITSTRPSFGLFRGVQTNRVRQEADFDDAAVSSYLDAQHHPDGSHGAITVDSVQETGRGYLRPMGEWTDVPWTPANFAASGGMTWTPTAAQQALFHFTLLGKTLIVQFDFELTSISGGANQLLLTIPEHFISKKTCDAGAMDGGGTDNGASVTTKLGVTASGTFIRIIKSDNTNWAASVNNSTIRGTILFEVL